MLFTILCSCARIGSPDGGPKDSIPPVMAIAKPMNKTTLFNDKKIVIYFDEYVKFKNLNRQLIISPPMEKKPIIKPEAGVSKKISIEFLDPLAKNTTYTINFGNSIIDNNEGNELGRFSYVFSTGPLLDSLSISGNISDPYENKDIEDVSILAYKNANDTIIGNYTPNYLSNTLKSSNYSLENLSEADYKIIAIEDNNNNYKYDKGYEKIGFLNKTIGLKSALDSVNFVLFKESKPAKVFNPTQTKGNQIIIGFQGNKNPILEVKDKITNKYFVSKSVDKDSMYLWFKQLPKDSITILAKIDTIAKKFTIAPRELQQDTLLIKNETNSILHPQDSVKISYNNPVIEFKKDSIVLLENDSIPTKYFISNFPEKHYLNVSFKRKKETNYTLKVNQTAFKDFLNNYNQKETIKFNTLNAEEYGEIILNLKNPKKTSLIIQLMNSTKKRIYTQFASTSQTVNFKNIEPDEYNVRIIKDLNKDSIYNSGNFENRLQPEEVLNVKKNIKLRANSEIIEIISID
ncbi:Ig-like domain-containing protein [Wenyingzhuangia sp. IMCC45533]